MKNREKIEKDLINNIKKLSDEALIEFIEEVEGIVIPHRFTFRMENALQITNKPSNISFCESVCKIQMPELYKECEKAMIEEDETFYDKDKCKKGKIKWLNKEYKPTNYFIHNE